MFRLIQTFIFDFQLATIEAVTHQAEIDLKTVDYLRGIKSLYFFLPLEAKTHETVVWTEANFTRLRFEKPKHL